jgi:DNA modification methylase
MDTGQALTRFFKRDSTKANNLTLHPHKEREFWLWVSTWAIFINKPSDLGYSDSGYDLPELKINWHKVTYKNRKEFVDKRSKQISAFADVSMSLAISAKEKSSTIDLRFNKAKEIIDKSPNDNFLLWHSLESERDIIHKNIKDAKCVYGSQKDDLKEQLLIDFTEGKYRILATKPIIAGQGCNFQKHCHRAIFMGIDYKFNDFIQAIHRIQRFQQKNVCEIDIIYTDAEENVKKELVAKWERHKELVNEMTNIIKKYGLSNNKTTELNRFMFDLRTEKKGNSWIAINNDNVPETQKMKSNSVDLIVTSIPFANHYEYTPTYNDFGHTTDNNNFFEQMDYLTPELLRILKPGRLACIHVKDRINFGNVTGYGFPTVSPFHMETTFHFIQHGFRYCGMIVIETDVVRENNQTYRLGWTENCKDSTKMGVGSPEFVLLFRKEPTDNSKAYADIPVVKSKEEYTRGKWQIDARAKYNSSGNRLLTPNEVKSHSLDAVNKNFYAYFSENVYDFDKHVEIANNLDEVGKLPSTFESLRIPSRSIWVWGDVVRMRTLNSKQSQGREQNHICPLQIDLVERLIERYSNKGELVFDPFGGLMTVPYCAVNLGRKGMGVELNTEYFRCGVAYLKEIEYKKSVPTLFDLIKI